MNNPPAALQQSGNILQHKDCLQTMLCKLPSQQSVFESDNLKMVIYLHKNIQDLDLDMNDMFGYQPFRLEDVFLV